MGEWVGSSEGLGYLALRSKSQFLTERVYAAIFLLSLMGIVPLPGSPGAGEDHVALASRRETPAHARAPMISLAIAYSARPR